MKKLPLCLLLLASTCYAEEDKFEGERAAYCDIDTVIVEDGKEEKQELKEVPFLKKDGVWFMPPPII